MENYLEKKRQKRQYRSIQKKTSILLKEVIKYILEDIKNGRLRRPDDLSIKLIRLVAGDSIAVLLDFLMQYLLLE